MHANVSIAPLVGVAAFVERFYKPELDAAHNPRLRLADQSSRPVL